MLLNPHHIQLASGRDVNRYLDDWSIDLELGPTEGPQLERLGQTTIGALRFVWIAPYVEDAPGDYASTPDHLETVHVEYETTDASNLTPEAEDLITTEIA